MRIAFNSIKKFKYWPIYAITCQTFLYRIRTTIYF